VRTDIQCRASGDLRTNNYRLNVNATDVSDRLLYSTRTIDQSRSVQEEKHWQSIVANVKHRTAIGAYH
jgi:hypothetical protein